jgi:chaperonin GroEL (HSP60 family)
LQKKLKLKIILRILGFFIRQAASKQWCSGDDDGTTTATVLAYAMVKRRIKNVAAGANQFQLN